MKRAVLVIGVALGVIVAVGVARAGIEGSKHDFSNEDWTGGDSCAACHTPESERPADAPKWNPSADLSRRFGTAAPQRQRRTKSDQSGPTEPTNRRQLGLRRYQLGPGTTTCLRCHDGALASDLVPYDEPRPQANTFHPGRFASGHGSSNHPVGVPYPMFDRKYHAAGTVTAAGAVSLPDGKVECISCHDPHNDADLPSMLVATNSRSALCLTCHRK